MNSVDLSIESAKERLLNSFMNEQEEILLAVVAAGVPINRITFATPKIIEKRDYISHKIQIFGGVMLPPLGK